MSGIFGELQRASQALNAQSQGVYTTGRNMANVNNAAYSRQRVILGDRGTAITSLGPQGLGVEALGLQHIRDTLLDSQVARETGFLNTLAAESDAYFKAQVALGQQVDRQNSSSFVDGATTAGSGGIGESLDNLFNAFSALSSDPRSTAERQILFQHAQTLVSRFRAADARLAELQTDIDAQIDTDLTRVNELLETISGLNKQIGRFEVGKNGAALDLRDQRQAKIEELSKYIDVVVEQVPDSAGQIRLLSRDATDTPVVLLDSGNAVTPITFDGTNFSGGTPTTQLDVRGGSLLGHITARDGAVANLRTGLDQLAAQLVTAVNAAYNPGGVSTDFFDAAGLTAATIAIDSTLTANNIRSTNSTNPGANDVALALADLAATSFSTGGGDFIDGTLSNHYRDMVSGIANATSSATDRLEDQKILQRLMVERRDSVSGVSLDEEMTNLVKYQRAFDANARVMRTLDEMLDIIVNQLVR